MNGQLHHLIQVVDTCSKYLNGKSQNVLDDKHYSSLVFIKQNENTIIKKLMGKPTSELVIATKISEFQKYLENNKCKKVYIHLSVEEDDINLSAYANGIAGQLMVCEFNNYIEIWRNSFNYNGEKWDVVYYMIDRSNKQYKPVKRNLKEEYIKLINCYESLEEFALLIEQKYWAEFFEKGKRNLLDIPDLERNEINKVIQNIKWPFGGMGSWNDSPPYSAHEKGLDEDFKVKSNMLYNQLHVVIEAILNM